MAPTQCPWGHKALGGYLGEDRDAWAAHDACALIADAPERLPLLVDQGDADGFLEEQLKPQAIHPVNDGEYLRLGGNLIAWFLYPGRLWHLLNNVDEFKKLTDL